MNSPDSKKKVLITGISIAVALLHFLTGPSYGGPYPEFVNFYLIDILLPFSLYFLISPVPLSMLQPIVLRAGIPFVIGVSVEIAQFYGLPVLGRTYDPLDFLAYGVGVILAILFDFWVFPNLLSFWIKE